ncbi:MAG: hypothetical protein WBQ75_01350 [Acetobacteraceae bacterium]
MHAALRFIMLAVLLAAPVAARADTEAHRLVIHMNDPTKEIMIEALHNAGNVMDYYRAHDSSAAIEIVANGRGVTMFVKDLSPVAAEVAELHTRYPSIVFDACAISLAHTEKALGRKLEVMPPARIIPSGAVRILELEEQHYGYLKP